MYEKKIKRTMFDFLGMDIKINEDEVIVGNKKFDTKDIDKIKYVETQILAGGIINSGSYYEVFIGSSANNNTARIFFNTAFRKKWTEEYRNIIDVLWDNVTNRIVNNMIKDLNEGRTVRVGKFEVTRNGINVLMNKKYTLIPWLECLKEYKEGCIHIYSNSDLKVKGNIEIIKEWNSNAFASLLDWLWKEGRCFNLEKGEKI